MPAAASHRVIAFQGQPGAYSDLACRSVYPDWATLSCPAFEDVFQAVHEGRAELAMIPIENSVAGRVADIHHLLPDSRLHIVGEHFHKVNHNLLAPRGAQLGGLREVHSHVQALSQCRNRLRSMGLKPVAHADTAGAAAEIAARNDPSVAAIASELAAKIYDLDILAANMEDAAHNTTRFIIMAREPADCDPAEPRVVTSFVFKVRNVPAALYKALGGFATNGVNMTKLESYMLGGVFAATRFYADIEGHPESRPVRLALEELGFFSSEVKILGVYPGHPYRFAKAG